MLRQMITIFLNSIKKEHSVTKITYTIFVIALSLNLSPSSVGAQEGKNPLGNSTDTETNLRILSRAEMSSVELRQPASETTVRFGVVNANKTVSYDVVVPYTKELVRKFAVPVPYTFEGKTEMREETRDATIQLNRARFENRTFTLKDSDSSLTTLDGQPVSPNSLAVGQVLVILDEGQSINDLQRRALKGSVLVLKLSLTAQQKLFEPSRAPDPQVWDGGNPNPKAEGGVF